MADPRFFGAPKTLTLESLASITNSKIARGNPQAKFTDVAPLTAATRSNVSFLDNKRYISQFSRSNAGACVIAAAMVDRAPEEMSLLVAEDPYLAYALIAAAFYPKPLFDGNISKHAMIVPSAVIGSGSNISHGTVIEENVRIGSRCWIGPNVVIEPHCLIGNDTRIEANASLSYCIVGDRVHVYQGACIGQDGFGFASSLTGAVRVPQLGRVIIGNDVEIGANTTIDRGAGPDTVIGPGCMIDNMVHIGHNVEIGAHTIIVSQVGISGSTKIGNSVVIGGQSGFAGHIEIGDGAKIAARSGVFRNIEPGITVAGFPAKPRRQWLKEHVIISKLTKKRS